MRAGRSCPAGLAVLLVSLLLAACASQTPPPARPVKPYHPPSGAWLGLAYNSDSGAGQDYFSARGIVYDRSGDLEAKAGRTLSDSRVLARAVRASLRAGMIPDVEIDPATGPTGCQGDPNGSTLCLPDSAAYVNAYVRGFVATARSIVDAYPHKRFVFEPMNEPWNWASPPGTQSGAAAARQYAEVLAPLLRAAREAGLPMADIYAPATDKLQDGTSWIPDLYAAEPCLAGGAQACGPIGGWSVHPYGLPHSTSEGIGSVPGLRREMRTGEDNIIVTEIGFCAADVDRGRGCSENVSDVVSTGAQTALWLRETLDEALPMRRAGWLKGLLIWDRAGDGWSMQSDAGTLTPQGRVLVAFADRWVVRPR